MQLLWIRQRAGRPIISMLIDDSFSRLTRANWRHNLESRRGEQCEENSDLIPTIWKKNQIGLISFTKRINFDHVLVWCACG